MGAPRDVGGQTVPTLFSCPGLRGGCVTQCFPEFVARWSQSVWLHNRLLVAAPVMARSETTKLSHGRDRWRSTDTPFCAPVAPRRSLVTPDSDPGSSLSSASRDSVRGNDYGRDNRPTRDCFAALAMTYLEIILVLPA